VKALKIALSVIISVFLAFSAAFSALYLPMSSKITDSNFYMKKLDKHGVYDSLTTYAEKEISKSAAEYLVPESVTKGVVSKEYIKKEVDGLIAYFPQYLKGEIKDVPKIDYNTPYAAFMKSYEAYAKERTKHILFGGALIASQMKKQAEASIQKKINTLPFSEKWNETNKDNFFKAMDTAVKFNNILKTVFIIALIAFFSLILLLCLLQRKIKSILIWCGSSILAGGVISIITAVVLKGYLSKLAFASIKLSGNTQSALPNLDKLIDDILSSFLSPLSIYTILILVVGIAAVVIPIAFIKTNKTVVNHI
jgi:hypothetical protein